MKKAIIIYGSPGKEEYLNPANPSPSNHHWLPWIQRRLILKGILAQTPEMPEPYDPDYQAWKRVIEGFAPDADTLLVGHSSGGGFLLRYLSEMEKSKKVGRVVLVAPWIDPDGEFDRGFFDFEIDAGLAKKTDGLVVMYSTDDSPSVLESIAVLKKKLAGAVFQEFSGKGHFTIGRMKTEEFPELLENVLSPKALVK